VFVPLVLWGDNEVFFYTAVPLLRAVMLPVAQRADTAPGGGDWQRAGKRDREDEITSDVFQTVHWFWMPYFLGAQTWNISVKLTEGLEARSSHWSENEYPFLHCFTHKKKWKEEHMAIWEVTVSNQKNIFSITKRHIITVGVLRLKKEKGWWSICGEINIREPNYIIGNKISN